MESEKIQKKAARKFSNNINPFNGYSKQETMRYKNKLIKKDLLNLLDIIDID